MILFPQQSKFFLTLAVLLRRPLKLFSKVRTERASFSMTPLK